MKKVHSKEDIVSNILIAFAILLPIIFIGFFVYKFEYETKDIEVFKSDINDYRVVFKQVGESDFPFGNTKVKVVVYNKTKKIKTISDNLPNDGKNACSENIRVIWLDDRVRITLIPEEGNSIYYEVMYK